MCKDLYIYDASSIISAGGRLRTQLKGPVVTTPQGFTRWSLDVGGITFLFTHIFQHINEEKIFVFDSIPYHKLELCPTYKGNRDHSSEDKKVVYKQRDLCELILKDIGIATIRQEGYEADDIVYSYWYEHCKDYDHVYIVTGDSDYYFMVDKKTSILPATSRNKTVTLENYSEACSKSMYIPYNTLLLNKILFGEPGDNVPSVLTVSESNRLWNLYLKTMPVKEYFRERDVIESFLKTGTSEGQQKDLLYMLDMIYPVLLASPEVGTLTQDDAKLFEWGQAVGNSKYGNSQSSRRVVALLEEWLYSGAL